MHGSPPPPQDHRAATMLINFFFTLRAAKLPVSVKEYLTLLQAIEAGVIDGDPESDDAEPAATPGLSSLRSACSASRRSCPCSS